MSLTNKHHNTTSWFTLQSSALPVAPFMKSAGQGSFMLYAYIRKIKRLSCFVLQD
ncbi:hypothetical protein B0I18_101764 [Taibaiella chishuiensis]|uniref:Uncharacterized protein n=1 Tax=Taibaiella chishuiensis TaxID=1434707 RepID=A0A2P8DBK0_9BACT|nr:hypothetical protein B0I18_101764 [Taibaiella chishuiensis]